jgi:ribonuclease-3
MRVTILTRKLGNVVPAADRILNNRNLDLVGREHGIEKMVISGGSLSNAKVATTVEALIGAVFKDSGDSITAAKRCMDMLGLTAKV